ncbi:unnamed protein product (macronuclear) [Paramecium tetraurelia]|uniref:Uncharacterized protein n=1 Tax=Paramecium tetraurelia TaxID=5888 RepID=A0D533_PARTE|nr:uncharacterized protein GSPATT00013597001 [Paramecium tetraurelia]CAK78150.1 unnamed protein product [Paramecium tetraurelia]|eukprot:XP_001445547.1 hypothetical protein (macronuclear) [Paramecium tetraurelia strain d4-2]
MKKYSSQNSLDSNLNLSQAQIDLCSSMQSLPLCLYTDLFPQFSPIKDQYSQLQSPLPQKYQELQNFSVPIASEQGQNFNQGFQICKLLESKVKLDTKVQIQESSQNEQKGGGFQIQKGESKRSPKMKQIQENQQVIKEDLNMNLMNQFEASFQLHNPNEENQFEQHESNSMLYETEKGQRKHDSYSKTKTQTEVQNPSKPIQNVGKEPELIFEEFIRRKFVQIKQGKEQKIEKNIKKYILSLYVSLICKVVQKHGKGCENIRNELQLILYNKYNDWKTTISTYFCIRKQYKQDIPKEIQNKIAKLTDYIKNKMQEQNNQEDPKFPDKKKERPQFSLEYIENKKKKKVRLNCKALQARFQTGKLKSLMLDQAKEKVKKLELIDKQEYDYLIQYFDLVVELKNIGGIKKSIQIDSKDIKNLHENTVLKQFIGTIQNILLKNPEQKKEQEVSEAQETLDQLLLEEQNIIFDYQETYQKMFVKFLEEFYQRYEKRTEIKNQTVTKPQLLQIKEKIQQKQEEKSKQICQEQEQVSPIQ